MSDIDIHAYHAMPREEAQAAAEDLAGDLAVKFDIDYGWEGDTIHFERHGAHGRIDVLDGEIRVRAHLGLLLIMLSGPIEQEVRRYLRDHFGCTFGSRNGSG